MMQVTSFSDNTELYTISNGGNLTARILTYGATLQSLEYRGIDVVLGYDSLEAYKESDGYLGATVGRYANRISRGKFSLNGVNYDVGANENEFSHLHGGNVGFDKHIWKVISSTGNTVLLSRISPDGEEGYPGTLDISVCYTVTDNDELVISYRGVSDKDTVLNITNHSYFNLAGAGTDIYDTVMRIASDKITTVDDHLIPDGNFMEVAGTPFDFNEPKPIGRDIGSDFVPLRKTDGYDHNFVLKKEKYPIEAYSPKSNIVMRCSTDLPGVQFYTSNVLTHREGKNGVFLEKHNGFCLETQYFPDTPNKPGFPSCVLKAGEEFKSSTTYSFSDGLKMRKTHKKEAE